MYLVQVAVPVPLKQLFSYTTEQVVAVGARVQVNFAQRYVVAIVMQVQTAEQWQQENDFPLSKVKPITTCLDTQAVLSNQWLRYGKWLASYYHYSLGETLHALLPVMLRKAKPCLPAVTQYLALHAGVRANASELIAKLPTNAHKRKALLSELMQGEQALTTLKKNYSSSLLKTVLNDGLVSLVEQPYQPVVWHTQTTSILAQSQLQANAEQGLAIGGISSGLENFACHLLDGVTGSGKTEVYLQVIAEVLQRQKQVLILVPEISLTPQTVRRFVQRFAVPIAEIHSGMSNKARFKVWQQVQNEEVAIVIGTRSSVFLPFAQLGLIIIDEEHDDSFKQQDGLCYHARDFALYLAKQTQIPVVMGSATPSLESLYKAQQGRYQYWQLSNRAGNAQHVQASLVDCRQQPLQCGLSEQTLATMQRHLQAGQQVMVFLNRRGFAPAYICQDCGEVKHCHGCERPLVVHRAQQVLKCHHCGWQERITPTCQRCHGQNMQATGMGVEQLATGLASLFPQYQVARLDSDTIAHRDALATLLDDIVAQKYQLLVGTQIMAKGHHFRNVTCVCIVDVDAALFSADFRMPEKLTQLITQVAGRAGREHLPGELLLQTHQPGHPILQDWLHNGYAHVAQLLLAERQAQQLPPYQYQILLRAEHAVQATSFAALQTMAQVLRHPQAQVLGPMAAGIEKRQHRYRFYLILQASERKLLHQIVQTNFTQLTDMAQQYRVRWGIDVDPVDFS